MPTALPVTAVSMNYASVVLVGFGVIAAGWYAVHSRKCECFFFLWVFILFPVWEANGFGHFADDT